MNQFSERYKGLNNANLIKIIEKQADYQLEAVEAARQELDSRKLSEAEMNAAKDELAELDLEKASQSKTQNELEEKLRSLKASALDTFNPIQESIPTTADKKIKLISIFYGLILLYEWYKDSDLISLILSQDFSLWDWSTIFYAIPFFFLPLAIILFYLKKKIGWIMMGFYLSTSIVIDIVISIEYWKLESKHSLLLYEFMPFPPYYPIIPTILLLWVMLNKELLEAFNLTRKTAFRIVFISALLTALLGLLLLI